MEYHEMGGTTTDYRSQENRRCEQCGAIVTVAHFATKPNDRRDNLQTDGGSKYVFCSQDCYQQFEREHGHVTDAMEKW